VIRSSGGHKHPIRWLVPLLIATFGVVVVLFVVLIEAVNHVVRASLK